MIKKEIGTTVQDYIQQKIVNIAKDKIMDEEQSVSEIAYELPQHFTSLFKKRTGYTPNEYKKSQLTENEKESKKTISTQVTLKPVLLFNPNSNNNSHNNHHSPSKSIPIFPVQLGHHLKVHTPYAY